MKTKNKVVIKDHIWKELCAWSQWHHILCITLLVVVISKGFDYAHWGIIGKLTERLIYLYFILCFFLTRVKEHKCHFRTMVICLMLIPLISMINTYFLYGQSFIGSFYALMGTFTWVIYFLLHKYNVSEGTIFRALLTIALFIFVIQVVQQFTFPDVYFGGRTDDQMIKYGYTETAEMRNGIWRFRMHNNAYYTAPVLFALWCWIYKKIDAKLASIVTLLLISVYLTLTRQVIAACVLTILSSFFMHGGSKHKKRALLITLFLIICLYASYELLFSDLVEQTSEEETDDNIRILAALYFWDESIQNPIVFLGGHGVAYSATNAYGKYMTNLSYIGFFPSDVGFIGQIYERGVIFVITTYILMYELFFKLKKVVPLYIRLFVLFTTIMSPMIFPIINATTIVVWAMLLYVCDLHINKSSLALLSTQNTK